MKAKKSISLLLFLCLLGFGFAFTSHGQSYQNHNLEISQEIIHTQNDMLAIGGGWWDGLDNERDGDR